MIKLFRVSLRGFQNIVVFIELELGQTETQGGHKPGWCPPRGAPPELVGPSWIFWLPPEASSVTYIPEKFLVTFYRVWTSVGMVFLRNQKQAENSNWHWALD